MYTIAILLLCSALANGQSFQDHVQATLACATSPEQFLPCAGKSLTAIIDQSAAGIQEFGLQGIDPLNIPNQRFNALVVSATLTNIQIYGLSKVQIRQFNVDPTTLKGNAVVLIPRIRIKSGFDGEIHLVGTFSTTSDMEGDFYNVQGAASGNLRRVTGNGLNHFHLDNLVVKFTVADGNITLSSKQPTAKMISSFFNSNSKSMLATIGPTVSGVVQATISQVVNTVLDQIPVF